VKLRETRARRLPEMSVILPECKIRLYSVPAASSAMWLMVKTLPLMVVVMGIVVPVVVFSSIHMVPDLMGSLKVNLMTLLRATFTAFLRGSP